MTYYTKHGGVCHLYVFGDSIALLQVRYRLRCKGYDYSWSKENGLLYTCFVGMIELTSFVNELRESKVDIQTRILMPGC